MPVFVTRADLGIGPDLVAALSGDGADVRAFATGSGDSAPLRAAGAFVAVGELDDEGHLDAAMTDVHTVVIPTDTWLADPDELVTEVDTIVTAAGLAAVRRVVLVSLVGAAPTADARVLAAYGKAEAALAKANMQTLVVRTDGIVEHGFADLAAAVDCDAEVAPVAATRLVDGLVALDAARSGRADGHAVFTALGEPRTLRPATSEPDEPSSTSVTLVGRRWLPPDQQADLRAALCGRDHPPTAGSDLWDFASSSS